MDNFPAEYQTSQVSLFMAGVNKDLEDHVSSKSAKYDFNFDQGKPVAIDSSPFTWCEVSDFSKSEVTGKKPRINVGSVLGRDSTAQTTLHSFQPDVLSARGACNISLFSIGEEPNNSSYVEGASGSHSLAQQQHQIHRQRFAGTRPDFTASRHCIPEVSESTESPYQPLRRYQQPDCSRESLAEMPEAEGSIHNPFMLTVSAPFSEQITQGRLIPSISNQGAVGESLGKDELVSRLQDLQVATHSQNHQPQRLDTDAELEQELENLGELEGDGPGDTSRLHVYSTAQHFTNIQSLENQVVSSSTQGPRAPELGSYQNQ